MKQVDVQELVKNSLGEVTGLIQDLVRIPTKNTAPTGNELKAQQYLSNWLRQNNLEHELFTPDEVPGLPQHPAFWPGRDYTRRPNVVARVPGQGGGRSLILSCHMDTVQREPLPWKVSSPFSGEIIGKRLYGRGAYDMKGGLAASAFLLKLIQDNHIRLKGDLLFESIVDEERCGSNGTLASRVKGYLPDVAILPEISDLSICPTSKGAKVYELLLKGSGGHSSVSPENNPIVGMAYLICGLKEYETQINARKHGLELYAGESKPRKVGFGMLRAGDAAQDWDFGTVTEARVTVVVLTLPGYQEADLDHELSTFVLQYCKTNPVLNLFAPPEIISKSRYIFPSQTDPQHPIFQILQRNHQALLGKESALQGAKFACDSYIFSHFFAIPTVIFGPRGGNAHTADEWLDLDSLYDYMAVTFQTILDWCGQ